MQRDSEDISQMSSPGCSSPTHHNNNNRNSTGSDLLAASASKQGFWNNVYTRASSVASESDTRSFQNFFPFTYELLNNSNDLLQAIFYFGSAAILRRKFAVSVSAAATATGGSWSSVAPGDVGGRREQLQHRVGLHVSARYIRVEINLENKTKSLLLLLRQAELLGAMSDPLKHKNLVDRMQSSSLR